MKSNLVNSEFAVPSSYRPSSYRPSSYSQVRLAILLLLPLFTGCSYLPWPDTYGSIVGPNSTRSLNGLAVYRRMLESAGARVLTPQKLSPRLNNVDAIILVGTTYQPPGSLARDWIEKWLGEKTGRTAVYFGRDFDANLLYREETLSRIAVEDQERAQDELASRRASIFVTRNKEIPEETFCRWFFIRTSARPTEFSSFKGPWAKELEGVEGKWPVSVLLEPPDEKYQSQKPSWVTGPTKPLRPVNPFTKGADADEKLGEKQIQRSIWQAEELNDAKAWDSEWERAGKARILLAGNTGAPLVYRLEHPKFANSKLLIIANGAPFLNGSLVRPLHRRVSELVIKECLPAKRVAMIEFGEAGLLLSNVDKGSESNVGMELLTVWPLSAITMHAAFLGILAFAVLLPILGRPQQLPARTLTDFGLHVEALGRMLFESRDLEYGLKSIGDYFRKVRRESPPDWVTRMSAIQAAEAALKKQVILDKEQAKADRLAKKATKAAKPVSSEAPLNSQVLADSTPGTAASPNQLDLTNNSGLLSETESLPSLPTKPTNATPPDAVS